MKDLNILPFNDCVLNNLKCLNTLLQGQCTLRTKTVNIVPYSFNTIGENKLEQECHAYDVLELSEHVKQCFELSDCVRVSMLVTVDQFWSKVSNLNAKLEGLYSQNKCFLD